MYALIVALAVAGCSFEYGIDPSASDAGDPDTAPAVPHRKPITIDHTQVVGTQQAFPLWVDIADPELAAGARVDGGDLFFTDASDRALPYEIARWQPAAGQLAAWVGLPELGADTDLVIYLRYGTLVGVPAPAPAQVFAHYAAVWHFDDSLATTRVADALGATPGTAIGLDASRATAGRLAGAFDFDGAAMAVAFDNMLLGDTPHAISAWVDQRTRDQFEALVVVGSSSVDESRWLFTAFDAPNLAFGLWGDNVALSGPSTDLQGAGWTLVDWLFDGDDRSWIYLDGELLGAFTHGGFANTLGAGGWIGWAPSGWGAASGLNGKIDEVRIAKGLPSNGWIATEWANQKAGSTLLAIGPAELVP